MLKGFTVPLTPDGKSALATLPPWHYSSDCIAIEYWADPAAIERSFRPASSRIRNPGGAPSSGSSTGSSPASNDELTDPARYQYREAFALVEAIFEGTPVNYCPYIFVDNDAALARGWAQGFPKKLGSIYQTRSFSAPSARPRHRLPREAASAPASQRMARRLATARIQLEEKSRGSLDGVQSPDNDAPVLSATRRRPSAKAAGDELTFSLTDDLTIVDVWAGSAELDTRSAGRRHAPRSRRCASAGAIVSGWRTPSRTCAS